VADSGRSCEKTPLRTGLSDAAIPIKRLVEDENRYHFNLLPERLDDSIAEDNAVCVIDAFVEKRVLP
jgi:hypothetical protein